MKLALLKTIELIYKANIYNVSDVLYKKRKIFLQFWKIFHLLNYRLYYCHIQQKKFHRTP